MGVPLEMGACLWNFCLDESMEWVIASHEVNVAASLFGRPSEVPLGVVQSGTDQTSYTANGLLFQHRLTLLVELPCRLAVLARVARRSKIPSLAKRCQMLALKQRGHVCQPLVAFILTNCRMLPSNGRAPANHQC